MGARSCAGPAPAATGVGMFCHRAGEERGDRDVAIGRFQGEPQRAVAAHRDAADGAARPLPGHGKGRFDRGRKVARQRGRIVAGSPGIGRIDIPGIAAVRHDHEERPDAFCRNQLIQRADDVAERVPVAWRAVEPVQQVQHGPAALRRIAGRPIDLRRLLPAQRRARKGGTMSGTRPTRTAPSARAPGRSTAARTRGSRGRDGDASSFLEDPSQPATFLHRGRSRGGEIANGPWRAAISNRQAMTAATHPADPAIIAAHSLRTGALRSPRRARSRMEPLDDRQNGE